MRRLSLRKEALWAVVSSRARNNYRGVGVQGQMAVCWAARTDIHGA
jgi:hypothetical protein